MANNLLPGISKIAIAIGFAFVVCSVPIGPSLADDHHGDDHGHAAGPDKDRGRKHHKPANPDYDYAQRDYYYAPPPNYYSAPEPEHY